MGAKVSKGGHSKKMGSEVEITVCKVTDIGENEMKEFPLGESGRVLLVNQKGALSALGTKCTHYGAPLTKGVLANGRIRCPWHGACFNATSGDIEDFPGLDNLPCYSLRVDAGEIKVKINTENSKNDKRVSKMSKRDTKNGKTVVVVGGGGAGQECVESLRQEGFTGRIILVSKEKHLPYDRPKLSKALQMEAEKLALRGQEFYDTYGIELWKEREVVALNADKKTLKLQGGEEIKYDSLVLATGGRPRKLDIPGADLKNVCILRTPDDGNFIASNAFGKKVIIIGTSFIGMEVAAFLSDKASSVTLVGPGEVPFGPVFGPEIGSRLLAWYKARSVEFKMDSGVKEFTGVDGVLKGVVLLDGTTLEADLCLTAIGVTPSTDFLKESGVEMDARGYVVVDKTMKSNIPDVYAAGDIASFPLFLMNWDRVNIGHWQMAMSHGRTAAKNVLGKKQEIQSVPFFWSVMFGKSLRFTGYSVGFEEVVIDGDLEALKFAASFIKGGKVVAVATMDRDPLAAKVAELFAAGKTLTKDDLPNLLNIP